MDFLVLWGAENVALAADLALWDAASLKSWRVDCAQNRVNGTYFGLPSVVPELQIRKPEKPFEWRVYKAPQKYAAVAG